MCIPFDIFIYMSRCFLIFWMVLDGFCLASQCGMAKHRQKHAEKFAEIRQVCHKLFQRVIPQNNFWYLAHLSSRQSGIQLRIIPGGASMVRYINFIQQFNIVHICSYQSPWTIPFQCHPVKILPEAGIGDPSFPTRSFVLRHIRQVARTCEVGDWFIWFWAGHGVNVPDFNGDEQVRTTGLWFVSMLFAC